MPYERLHSLPLRPRPGVDSSFISSLSFSQTRLIGISSAAVERALDLFCLFFFVEPIDEEAVSLSLTLRAALLPKIKTEQMNLQKRTR